MLTKTRKVRGFGAPAYYGYFRASEESPWLHVRNEHGGIQLHDTKELAQEGAQKALEEG